MAFFIGNRKQNTTSRSRISPSFSYNASSLAVPDGFTFTRASTGTFAGSNGLVQSAAINTPRFEHNSTGALQGLLIEEGRTNLHLQSAAFNNTAWTSTGITADATAAPDGTTTADRQVSGQSYNTAGVGSSTTAHTASRFMKADTGSSATLRMNRYGSGADYIEATFNLSAGTVGAVTNAGTASGGFARIVSYANGWYRCIVGGTTSTTAGTLATNVTPVGGLGIFIWGAQLESGLNATSYIPTTTAAATRAADVLSAPLLQPTGFANGVLPILPTSVTAPLSVTISRNAADACRAVNAALYANASEKTGITTGAAFNTWMSTDTESFARFTTNQTLAINNSSGLRNTQSTQSAGQRVKHVIADGCTVTLNITPPATGITALTYTDTGVGNVYSATLGTQTPFKIQRNDIIDQFGDFTSLRNYSTLALLQAADSGWFRSGTTLYVKMGPAINVEAEKSKLFAYWLDTGGNARLYMQGTIMCFEAINGGSVVFEGLNPTMSEASTNRRPEFWAHGTVFRHSPNRGIDSLDGGCYSITTNCTFTASLSDGINLLSSNARTGQALILCALSTFENTGDFAALGNNETLQGISAHGGVDHASYGNFFDYTNAPGIADTVTTGSINVSWVLGCRVINPSETSKRGFFFGSGGTGTRTAYVDTCDTSGCTTDLTQTTGATVFVYNNTLPVVSGSTVSYSPARIWWNATTGTILSEWDVLYDWTQGSSARLLEIDDGTSTNRIGILLNNTDTMTFSTNVATGTTADMTTAARGAVVRTTCIGRYALNDYALRVPEVTGGAIITDTAAVVPTGLTTFRLGSFRTSTLQPNGYLRRVQYWNTPLNDTHMGRLS